MDVRNQEGIRVAYVPKYPVIWYAEYDKIPSLKIPICLGCHQLIMVKNYDDIQCPCGSEEFSWDVSMGAKEVPLNNGFLLEFDEDGEETTKFDVLPRDGLLRFGLMDPALSILYGVDIRTGLLYVGSSLSGGEPFYLGTGLNADEVPSGIVKVSDAITKKEASLELIHRKRSIQGGHLRVSMIKADMMGRFDMDDNNIFIDNISVGYRCRVPGYAFEVIIKIDCNTHIPYFTTNVIPDI
jgi:hypothetical protein